MTDGFRLARFGRFTFDLVTLELTRDGRPITLPPQPARVLELLVRNAGRLVAREDLRDALWPDSVVDYEKGLNTAVRQVRDALGESASEPVFIETLPRRGYRFIADVEASAAAPAPPLLVRAAPDAQVDTGAQEGGETDEILEQPPAPPRTRAPVSAAGLIGVIVLVTGFVHLLSGGDRSPATLLVIPFANLTADPENELVAGGLTEELRTYLSSIASGRVTVLARTTAERYRSATDLSDLREDLEVDYVLEGSLLSGVEGLRVVTRLVETPGEKPVWQGEFEGSAYEGQVWRREIGRGVARHLGIADDFAASAPLHLLSSPEARLAYLKARHSLSQPGSEAAANATTYLVETLESDPRYAPALAGLAEARFRSGDLEGARDAAQRAIERDPGLAEAHRVLGAVLLVGDRDLTASRPHFERAATAPTARPEDHQAYAFYLFLRGDPEAGLDQARAAFGLDPLSAVLQGDVGVFHLWAGEPREAFGRCSLAAELDPEHTWAYRCLVDALQMMERDEDVLPHLRRLMMLEGADTTEIRSVTAKPVDRMLSAYRRWRIADLEARSPRSGADRFALARLYAAEGHVERAIDLLERAASDPPLGFPTISVDPAFRPLATHPRFQRLLDELWLD